jgi:hypothetical protein
MRVLEEGDPALVWGSMFKRAEEDDFDREVQVQRVGRYEGMLCVFDPAGELEHSEPVALSYGAMLGPDPMDIRSWQAKVEATLDG